jgi:alpha-ketoglutarate-dependent taurine dioxygenase
LNYRDPSANDLFKPRRKSIRLSRASIVNTGYLDDQEGFPLVIEQAIEGTNLISWASHHRDWLEHELLRHGAILFRGFALEDTAHFEGFVKTISPDLLDYHERAAPRREVSPRIYTSTEYPADQYIPLHHELAHSHFWPGKIWFYCSQPPAEGGETPIASERKVFQQIHPRIRERFERHGVMYIRNYSVGLDLPWQEVFQTSDRAAVEEYCRKSRMTCEWGGKDEVRMRAVRQATTAHPVTREPVWFNHAHMFHCSNLEPQVRRALLADFKETELPRNAFYGDGAPIEDSVLDEIRGLYRDAAVKFPWRRGDLLMLDNFLASHGREPFIGPRKILVAMAEVFRSNEPDPLTASHEPTV